MEAPASHLILPQAPGAYALALRLSSATRCQVGALGTWDFPAGAYLYVGSAWGSGGLAARVGRHLRGGSRRHWHIDYLRQHAPPVGLWLAPHARLECAWAAYLLALPAARVIVPRFGASDCACPAHLVYFDTDNPGNLDLPDAQGALVFHFVIV